ncbi:hypothetical protein KI387_027225, partial [Taxus chinensis]
VRIPGIGVDDAKPFLLISNQTLAPTLQQCLVLQKSIRHVNNKKKSRGRQWTPCKGLVQMNECVRKHVNNLRVGVWNFGVGPNNQDDENKVIARKEIVSKVKMLMEGEEGVTISGAEERFRDLAKGT